MRFALGVEYQGTHYSGWQRQHHKPSVQENLERALSKVAAHPILTVCAGRTDAGVHASAQVVHFDTQAERVDLAWTRGVNAHLPPDIRVNWCAPVSPDFHARYSAIARRYVYIILNRPTPVGIMHNALTWFPVSLDHALMQSGAQHLLGSHDFNAFRAAQCQSKTSDRTVHSLTITRRGDYIVLDIKANAFLHHMVRNIVGTLVAVGRGDHPPQWVQTVLASKDRRSAGITAPPTGLYLAEVFYQEPFNALAIKNDPWFLTM